MKPTIIIALAGFSALTTAALHKKRHAELPAEWGIGCFGGTVGQTPNPMLEYVTPSSGPKSTSTTTITTTTTYTVVETVTRHSPSPSGAVKRGEYFLDGGIHAKQNGLLSQQEEVDSLVESLNHAFGHGALVVGGECGLLAERGCAGNKVVECRDMVWEAVEDCRAAGLGMACKAVSEEVMSGGGWIVGVGCLRGGMVRK